MQDALLAGVSAQLRLEGAHRRSLRYGYTEQRSRRAERGLTRRTYQPDIHHAAALPQHGAGGRAELLGLSAVGFCEVDTDKEDERAPLLLPFYQPTWILRDCTLPDTGRGVSGEGKPRTETRPHRQYRPTLGVVPVEHRADSRRRLLQVSEEPDRTGVRYVRRQDRRRNRRLLHARQPGQREEHGLRD